MHDIDDLHADHQWIVHYAGKYLHMFNTCYLTAINCDFISCFAILREISSENVEDVAN